MIIDLHTHIFPEKIAEKTIGHLAKRAGITPFSDGTAKGLTAEMEQAGVDISVTLPVLTSPEQFDSVNRFAHEINIAYEKEKHRLISFAGIHPDCDDIDGKMSFIKERGFLGVKIHPDYQNTFINDDRYVKILECAKKNNLIVVTHAGVDMAYAGLPVRCTPARAKELIQKVPGAKLVLAHMGANEMYEDVLNILAGEDVYFDTAFVLSHIDKATFKSILDKHGEDKILFATDSPWSKVKGDVDILKSYSLKKETENKIFYENAKKLLGI